MSGPIKFRILAIVIGIKNLGYVCFVCSVQSIRDVPSGGRRESGAGVERKGGFHQTCSLSSPLILVISTLRLERVREILCCHL